MIQQLSSIFSSDQELLPLLAKAQALSALKSQLIDVAPKNMLPSDQVQVLSLQMGTLSIAVINATIAAKLRQLAPEMVAKLQNKGCEVSGILVKVQVSFNRGNHTPPPRKLSKTTQNILSDFSQRLDTSPLKTALTKLAQSKR